MSMVWKTLSDLKEPAILWRLAIPFIASIMLVSLLGYSLFGVLLSSDWILQSSWVVQMDDWAQQAETGIASVPIIGAVLLWVVTTLFAIIAGVLGLLLGSYLVLLFAMIITGFMTDSLIKAVQQKHYPHLVYDGHGTTLGMIWKLVKFGFLILLLLLLTIPILFIPLINILWFWLLGFWFFRYSLVLDVGQVILSEADFEKVKGFGYWPATAWLAALFLTSTLPIIGLFIPVIAVIGLAHLYFETLEKGFKSPESV